MVYTLTVHMYAKDDAECIEKLKLKLIEAARVYRNDKGDRRLVRHAGRQGPPRLHRRRAFRAGICTSQKYHLENPYWKTFDPYVIPLLAKDMDLRRHEELDTSKDVVVPQ
ncbi:hypothetical protein PG994_001927 [Apiospora phragmitis]|uniref:Uncharacterized protein n=1 Tax=Apiospora phragmitis TaxID=2905665 RepID=A0ABR1WV12_9PEZI